MMVDRQRLDLLMSVARSYWIDGKDQGSIAKEIGYSPSMVSRLLSEARKEGVVTISVGHPLERAVEMETALKRHYELRGATVSLSSATADSTEVSRLAGQVLVEYLRQDSVVAVSNGHTISNLVRELKPLRYPHLEIIQALGAVADNNHLIDSQEICRILAEKFSSTYRVLPAPLVVSSVQMAAALRREDRVSTTLTMASHADIYLTGIGATSPQSDGAIFSHYLTQQEHSTLVKAGAVGHIGAHHFNASGEHLDMDICRRLIAVPFSRIKEIPCVIAVAWGDVKAAAISAALRGGLVDHLVTDMDTARLLLGMDRTD
ncbi:MAG: sugar-binding domain-containing protein [Actinomycetaceae bacterium]|nr:sugar-binding domain-containing protein [Actinomycetaceae bacterium]